jgi:HlyD family secretion protein
MRGYGWTAVWIMIWATAAAAQAPAGARTGVEGRTVTSLGRIEPRNGVIRVAGPSGASPVIAELLVEVGDRVEAGQVIARLDSHALRRAEEQRLRAELDNAKRELERTRRLARGAAASDAKLDASELSVRVAEAGLAAARARVELSLVRAPVTSQVLEVHARAGERIGPDGVVELGETDRMYAVAEVYETEISRVRAGQSATITSPALPGSARGEVERIGLKIGKLDVLDTDPVAKTDARVVEVHIRLDGGVDVSRLTNLQVEVEIHP